ncbi:hypothetical protein [Kitasatospora sp. GP82]|uniref:hypothetical protein n=1 Tax=Kitasatospora sp. GP82 TaxID=3035089 RepID=UPI0024763772|nr:hypothetical protein [Kitasatospora sp. GP82]
MKRFAGALALTFASTAALAATAAPAHAADSYYCGGAVTLSNGTNVSECIHLGGNGYWQPYMRLSGPTYMWEQDKVGQWINSANGHYGDFTHIPGGQYNGGIIWGQSTNWRVDCYVQAQAFISVPDEAYDLFSPTQKVC